MTMDDVDRMNRLKALEERADQAYQTAFGKKSNLGDLTATDEERMRRVETVLKNVEDGTPNNDAATVIDAPKVEAPAETEVPAAPEGSGVIGDGSEPTPPQE